MKHANNFDGLRLIAASMVLWSHMFALSGRPEPMVMQVHSYGGLGVLMFFSISGYLVSASWARDPDLGRFLAKRFLRIAPGLAVAIPLAYFVVSALGLYRFPDNAFHNLNGSLWTIEYEVMCYFILAGLSMMTGSTALVLTLGMLLASLYLPKSWLAHFGLFFAFGALIHRYPKLLAPKAMAAILVAAVVMHHEPKFALALAVPPLTIWVGIRSWPVVRMAGRYGDFSYGVYIYAWPVQQVAIALLGRENFGLLLAVSAGVTLPLACLSWRLVESPALGKKPEDGSASVGAEPAWRRVSEV